MAHKSGASPGPPPVAGASSPPQVMHESVEEDADDSSFETVAEALRLQWSVIGKSVLH